MTEKQSVHVLVAEVMRQVGAIDKSRENREQRFKFRGVDDVMNALAQPFRDHGVYVVPEVLETSSEVRQTKSGTPMNATRMRVAFHFHGPAGDSVTAITAGEGADVADKATNKAMAAAFKYALLYAFMIPTEGTLDEGDADHSPGVPTSHEASQKPAEPTKALIRTWVDRIYQARDVDALKRVWAGIAGSGVQDAETVNNEGNPATLSAITTARRQELEALEKEEPGAGA